MLPLVGATYADSSMEQISTHLHVLNLWLHRHKLQLKALY